MPAKDLFHQTVINALEKDGWKVTHDPFVLKYKDLTVIADLAAEKVFDESGERLIAVEIKVFGSKSKTTDFEKAKGQYDVYQFALRKNAVNRILFLAISDGIYQSFFSRPSIRELIAETKMNLLIFNAETEEIVKWINWNDTAQSSKK